MSVIPLKKVSIFGSQKELERALSGLQSLGMMHPMAWDEHTRADDRETVAQTRKTALADLRALGRERKQATDWGSTDIATVTDGIVALRQHRLDLTDRRDFLAERIANVEPWGDFRFPSVAELDGQRLWFYRVPHYQLDLWAAVQTPWEVVRRDNQSAWICAVSPTEPLDAPTARTRVGKIPLSELKAELERVEAQIEEIDMQRFAQSRYRDLLEHSVARAEDAADRRRTASLAMHDDSLFALKGWWPEPEIGALQTFCEMRRLALLVEDPSEDDRSPTLLRNTGLAEAGQTLVEFYSMPASRDWDPSLSVIIAFSIFFAMIMSDAGYSLILGAIVALTWKRMGPGPVRRMFASLVAVSVAYGVAVGGWFGATLPEGSFLSRIALIDATDADLMIKISVVVGAIHLVVANTRKALHLGRDLRSLANVGWALAIAGGTAAFLGAIQGGAIAAGLGLLLVVGFAAADQPLLPRIGWGLFALTNITQGFGDVLSYLRLFALGLASASLAQAFNGLAADANESIPAFNTLVALAVLVIGHTLNFVLAIMGGFVHGLRLNYLEFFNWSLEGDGIPFKPFRAREPENPEADQWTTSIS